MAELVEKTVDEEEIGTPIPMSAAPEIEYVLRRNFTISRDGAPRPAGSPMAKVVCHDEVNVSWIADAIRGGTLITKAQWDELQRNG